MARIAVSLDPDLESQVRELALQQDRSLSKMLGVLVRAGLRAQAAPPASTSTTFVLPDASYVVPRLTNASGATTPGPTAAAPRPKPVVVTPPAEVVRDLGGKLKPDPR